MEDKIPYDELVYIKTEILDPIRDTLPTDKANAVFKSYQRLFPDDKQPQPCTCSSASRYWGDFIKRSKEKVEILLQEYLDTQKKDVNVISAKKSRKVKP